MRQGCVGKSYCQELIHRGKKNQRLASRHPRIKLPLFLGGNISGTLKLKPLLVFHSETPRVMKEIKKSCLPVIRTSNNTSHNKFSQNGMLSTFAIVCYSFAIKTICLERLFCCLTTFQGIHQTWKMFSHSSRLRFSFCPLLQKMDQEVIAAFKAYYLHQSLQEMIQQTDTSEVTRIVV